jgi:hypothetical protein
MPDTAVLLIGERDDGTIAGVASPDNIQKTVRAECEKIYPDILWRSTIYEKEGKYCVRVEIEYSGETPHFGGPAWVRKGSMSIKASDEVFQRLIDIRSDPIRELSQWLNKEVTVYGEHGTVPPSRNRTRLGVMFSSFTFDTFNCDINIPVFLGGRYMETQLFVNGTPHVDGLYPDGLHILMDLVKDLRSPSL